MLKHLTKALHIIIMICLLSSKQAVAGKLFNVTPSGTVVPPFSITLCLNAKDQLSCQLYNVSSLTLSISTTINHVYPNAGIKSNNPSYVIANCANPSKGYCIFSVSPASSNVELYPVTTPYSVSGSISGLISNGLVLQNNGADDLTISANANSFTIPYVLAKNGSYNVTIKSQPTRQFCSITNGSGTNVSGNITNVSIACTAVPIAYLTTAYNISNPPNVVQSCTLNVSDDPTVNGSFQSCTSNATPDSGWFPFGVAFASLNSTPYAYVLSNRNPRGLFACGIIANSGAFTGAFGNPYCFMADAIITQPTGVAIATIAGTQYLYYTDNVQNHAKVCTIDSVTGLLTCNNATPNGTPQNNSASNWTPFTLTLQTINGSPYAYVSAYIDQEAYVCPVNTSDGTFIACNDAGGASGTWSPHGIAFASVNNIEYAYVASGSDHYVYQCLINPANGGLFNCTTLSPPVGQNWTPQSIAFATVNGTQYAYVNSSYSDFNSTPKIYPSIFQCTLNNNGSFNTCQVTYSSSIEEPPQEVNITMQVIPG